MAAKLTDAAAAAPATAASRAETPNFEAALSQLEALVTKLESGDLPLDVALATFEQGVRLTRECQGALVTAQQKVQVLLQRGEDLVAQDFESGAGPDLAASE